MSECKHTNITIKSFARYVIPQGWEKLMSNEWIDMTDYFQDYDAEETWCDDCGEQLD